MRSLIIMTTLLSMLALACEPSDQPRGPSQPYTGEILDQVSTPPAYFGLDPYYTKYLDADGIPIFAGVEIPDDAIFRIRTNVTRMVSGEELMRRRLIDNYVRIAVLALIDPIDTIPELANKTLLPDQRSRPGDQELALMVVPEENVLCFPNDPSEGDDVFVRTFALTMLQTAIPLLEPSFPDSLLAAYERILQSGIWDNTLAAQSKEDYYAEGVQSYFNLNQQADPTDGRHNLVDTRIELKAYDPALYGLVERFFEGVEEIESCNY